MDHGRYFVVLKAKVLILASSTWMNESCIYIYMIQKVNSWFSLINNCRTTKSGWVFLSWNARFSMNIAMMFPLPKNYFLNLAFPNF
jgi:hypothetical protein